MKKRHLSVLCAGAAVAAMAWFVRGAPSRRIDNEDEKTGAVMKYNQLTPAEKQVIIHSGTERPFTGKYTDHAEKGTYVCRQCNAPLYRSDDKFKSHCGWPSFDDELEGAVERRPDPDGRRTEIVCTNCAGHLGHVFAGEGFTDKNMRHCVNSVSLDFIPAGTELTKVQTARAVFASGCFWGTEHALQRATGVIATTCGYTGGHKQEPTYREVCGDSTGHVEAVEVFYDTTRTDYETLARLFFETHDPTQTNGQGPDIGSQYYSVIYYVSEEQKRTAERLIVLLQEKGLNVATKVLPAQRFWPAEEYHQDYYVRKGSQPYCHGYRKLF